MFFAKDGYATSRATLNTGDTLRESPSDIVVGQVITPALFPLNGTLRARVFGQNQTNLIEGARVRSTPPGGWFGRRRARDQRAHSSPRRGGGHVRPALHR